MIGIIDVGGGMKAVYSAGVLDYCLEKNIYVDYTLGVSAGSGNLINYVARQKERSYIFYTDYVFRKEYMSVSNILKKGQYCDQNYPYSIISDEFGENPLDYNTLVKSKTQFKAVVTNAVTGKAEYYSKDDLLRNDYWVCKASSSIPIISKAFKREGKIFYDGGIANPIPIEKAFNDGCEKIIVILSRPVDFRKNLKRIDKFSKLFLKKYPNLITGIYNRADKYNSQLEKILNNSDYKEKVLLLAPKDTFGVDTLSKKKDELDKLYNMGYKDGEKIESFLKI